MVIKNYTYDAFGNVKSTGEIDTNPFRYCGEYTDLETNLVYLRARYMDPSVGRFISEDPVKDGLNWYVYCANNPVAYTDPFGLWDPTDEKYPWYIQQAIRVYTDEWEEADRNDDEVGRQTANNKANIARSVGDSLVSRSDWGAQDFYDEWENDTDKHAIVIHHTANNKSVKQIEEEHINGKDQMSGIGYHFIISKDGLIYIGRPLEVKGAHTYPFNTGRIGISVIGNFENEKPTAEQLTSLRNLTNVLKDLYSISNSSVVGHRDFNGQTNGEMKAVDTVCPGKNLYPYIGQYWPK